ncbi:MAG: acyltransferase [Candidatus Ancillula sp.]|jgi:peptidoglycan/LPS O-acetylase OafA/YrhL|nr:acyltransferase [Candidatus Ancillula sp.]
MSNRKFYIGSQGLLETELSIHSKRFYFPALSGLRFIAYTLVILHHTIPDFHPTFGPDAFYVLTGYLITFSLVNSLIKTNGPQLKRYFSRRFRNIMPALFILFALVQVYSYYKGDTNGLANTEHYGIAALFQVANWFSISDVSEEYWAQMGHINPFGQMWSLSVTEQFFFLAPFLIWIVFKISRKGNLKYTFGRMAICIGVIWVISTLVMPLLWADGLTWRRIYMGTDARLHEYLLGCFAACIVLWQHRSPSKVVGYFSRLKLPIKKLLLALTTLACFMLWVFMMFSFSNYQDARLYNGGFVIISVILTVLVLSLSHQENPFVKFFAHSFPTALGAYSYEIYVFHLFIATIIKDLTPEVDAITFFATTLVLSSLFSALMFHAVTYRFRVRKFNSERVIPVVASFLGLAIAVSLWMPYLETARIDFLAKEESTKVSEGTSKNKIVEHTKPDPVANFNVITLGDSIAGQYGDMFDAYNKSYGSNIQYVDAASAGCSLLSPSKVRSTAHYVWDFTKNASCQKWQTRFKDAFSDGAKHDIIMVDDDFSANDLSFDGNTYYTPCDQQYVDSYNGVLDYINEVATQENVKVAFSNVRPQNEVHQYPDYATCYNKILSTYVQGHQNWLLLDVASILCTEKQLESSDKCLPVSQEGKNIIQGDNVHFDRAGVQEVGGILIDQMNKFILEGKT